MISLSHWLFRSILFNFYVFVNFTAFFLLLISSFIPCRWRRYSLYSLSFLNFLRLVLWPNIWFIPANVPWVLDKSVYSFAVWWDILICLLDPYSLHTVLFKSAISLLVFCLDDPFFVERWVLKSPTIIVLLFISPFSSVSICFIYLGASILGA